jgi:hypothetical protein
VQSHVELLVQYTSVLPQQGNILSVNHGYFASTMNSNVDVATIIVILYVLHRLVIVHMV